jgi:hypothetical protein
MKSDKTLYNIEISHPVTAAAIAMELKKNNDELTDLLSDFYFGKRGKVHNVSVKRRLDRTG